MDPDRYAGFMRAILESPEDDAPRLVLADFLEEEGDPRGEFIRVGCELVAGPECLGCNGYGEVSPKALPGNWDADGPVPCPWCNRYDLRRRERELLEAHGSDAWGGWGPSGVPPSIDRGKVIRRGFVDSITCSCADFLAHGPAVCARQPVTKVTLSDKRPHHATDGETEWWGWFTQWDGAGREEHRLPAELADHLPAGAWRDGDLSHQRRPYCWRYHSPERALAALSTAALAFARAALPAPAGAPADATELADGPWRRRE